MAELSPTARSAPAWCCGSGVSGIIPMLRPARGPPGLRPARAAVGGQRTSASIAAGRSSASPISSTITAGHGTARAAGIDRIYYYSISKSIASAFFQKKGRSIETLI